MSKINLSEHEIRTYYESHVSKLKTSGKELRAPCPLHNGKRDSLSIDLGSGSWFCHSSCNRGGSIFDFEAELSGVNGKTARATVLALVGQSPEPERRIVAMYDYVDEHGQLLYQTVRYEPKDFRQRGRDGNGGGWVWNLRGVRLVLYRLPSVLAAPIVFIVEGEKDADALTELGMVATTGPMGAGKWRPEYAEFLRGKQVIVIPDADEKGRAHAADVMRSLDGVAASVKRIELPGAKDCAEWIGKGGTLDTLASLAEREEAGPKPRAEAVGLAEVIEVFRKWLHLPVIAALLVTLGAVAANLLKGDALWLLLVGATGSGKTEFLDALLDLPYNMHRVGTLTEASLLSGSPKREKADATGGLLRCIGDFGFLLLKDFTSVLAMSGEIRLSVLAALREIHDGHWTRHVGVDGGRKLPWSGKCALVGGCTPAIDLHHQVMAMMGERFVLMRILSIDGEKQADSAMEHIGFEKKMRAELRSAVSALFSSIRIPVACDFDGAARKRMAALASFVAHARRDSASGGANRVRGPRWSADIRSHADRRRLDPRRRHGRVSGPVRACCACATPAQRRYVLPAMGSRSRAPGTRSQAAGRPMDDSCLARRSPGTTGS